VPQAPHTLKTPTFYIFLCEGGTINAPKPSFLSVFSRPKGAKRSKTQDFRLYFVAADTKKAPKISPAAHMNFACDTSLSFFCAERAKTQPNR
jgi:hypothetical protein